MKTFRVETEDRYGEFNEYDLEAESLEVATAKADKRVNLPNGAFVVNIKEISEVQESTQKIEDNFSDVMPTAQEYWYDAQPETYEPNCYDGTYSEM